MNPITIQRESLLDEAKDPDFRFKTTLRVNSSMRVKRPRRDMRFKSNQLERVKDAIKANENLSSDPTEQHNFQTQESILNLRPLEKDKILDQKNPSFKYKANTSFERVYDTIQARRNTSTLASIDYDPSIKRSFKGSQSRNKLLTVSPRSLYPQMHQKTHFKAV